ncbi:hypothetical protein [Methylocystis sp. B8]|uniref:hypothetical protein n=1 Tax=Methylocystis sp. B8 TaxID=544938 RepID=UPI0010FD4202|nr:hypothetical protein [Methylocystis sp. B8]TLG78556.1 hypothetical protein FEV16_00465 [Methylocystis sp. B8]
MTAIDVRMIEDNDPLVFEATVCDAGSETRHRVTLSRNDFERLSDEADAERLINAAFCFLLDREPKESILARFDVSVIARYFPDFEQKLPRYLK